MQNSKKRKREETDIVRPVDIVSNIRNICLSNQQEKKSERNSKCRKSKNKSNTCAICLDEITLKDEA